MYKKILAVTALFALTTLTQAQTGSVYVCISNSSQVYHSRENCSALKRCTHSIKAMTKEQAINLGKRACKFCF
jgi:hypothetical protein